MRADTHGRFRWFNAEGVRAGLGRGRGDDATGDPVAGVASGVGLHVVRLLMHHDGGASVGDDAVGRRGIEREVVDFEGDLADVAFADGDVGWEVAGVVAQGVEGAVLLVLRIEVAARSFEVGGVAEGLGVDVDGVVADGQVFEVKLDGELFPLFEGGGTGVFAGAGLEGDDENVLRFGKCGGGEEAKSKEGEGCAHRWISKSATG